jgi:FMN reductase
MNRLKLVAVSGNPASPSRTRVLTDLIADAIERRVAVERHVVELSDTGPLLAQSHFRSQLSSVAEARVALVESADLLIVASPVYRGSYTGLFKHLFDLVGMDALAGKPVILAASGGSERHTLVIDHQLRPLFSFFMCVTIPTGIYATEDDFRDYRLVSAPVAARIEAAADETMRILGVPPAAHTAGRLAVAGG